MVKIARQAGQKCTLYKPLYCPKNGEHLRDGSLERFLLVMGANPGKLLKINKSNDFLGLSKNLELIWLEAKGPIRVSKRDN
jgi:hypothetical protein